MWSLCTPYLPFAIPVGSPQLGGLPTFANPVVIKDGL